jgi:hypothetical protein
LLRVSFLAAAIVAALGTAACSCPQSNILIDDFEGCSGTCGWTVSGGSASIVSTILPGEHGLRMDGGVTATKSTSPTTIDATYSLELVGNCPDGLSATISATVPNKPAISVMVMLAIDNSLDSSGNPPNYSGASYVPLVGAIDLPSGIQSASVHQVTLLPAAGGSCTVDLVRLAAAQPCGQ